MKKFLALILASTMLLSVTGCTSTGSTGGTSASTEATAETTEKVDPTTAEASIKFSWWGGDARHEATIAAIDAFMAKYPNIKVETEYGAWDGWATKQSTALYGGTAADALQINWNWINSYSPDGALFADINNYADIIDLSQFNQSALDACTEGGKLQAVPVAMTGRIFYWNKTTWDKAGLSTPTSMEELMAAGETFKTALGDDYYPLYLGEYDRQILMVYYLESVYGKAWVEDGALNYSKEEIVEGLNWITSLEEAHVIPTIQTIANEGAASVDKDSNWIDGHYAGLWEWDSGFTKEQGALADGQELIVGDYFKDWGEFQGGYAKVSMAFAISEKTPSKEAAALLINYLLNDPEGVEIMGTQRGIPLSNAALTTLKGIDGAINPQVADANSKVLAWTQFQLDPTFEDSALNSTGTGVYQDVFSGLSYGDYDAETAADKLIEGVSAVLAA